MLSSILYISENLRNTLKKNYLDLIQNSCFEVKCEISNNFSNEEFIKKWDDISLQKIKFVIGNKEDISYFDSHKKEIINDKFIILLLNQENVNLQNERNKDEFSKIRFVLAESNPHLFELLLKKILQSKSGSHFTSFCSLFQKQKSIVLNHDLFHSSERKDLQSEFTRFFINEFEKNPQIATQDVPTYLKNLNDILDELLMNAIWDANPHFFLLDRKKTVKLSEKEKVSVKCILNYPNLVLCVKDYFGQFEEKSIEKLIQYSLGIKETKKVETNQMGAGVGLYMILQKTGYLIFEIQKGILTNAIVILQFNEPLREIQKKPRTVLFFENTP